MRTRHVAERMTRQEHLRRKEQVLDAPICDEAVRVASAASKRGDELRKQQAERDYWESIRLSAGAASCVGGLAGLLAGWAEWLIERRYRKWRAAQRTLFED